MGAEQRGEDHQEQDRQRECEELRFGPADPVLADDLAAPGAGIGYGLTGMRERAALLGGTLTAGPTGNGFRVELWSPA